MEFWGVEVKSGQPLDVALDGKVLHLSQASLGELKKDKMNESVCLRIDVEGKNLVLGTLHSERLPQQMFDLVFDKDFKISHNWKNGSVYFYGYKADQHNGSDMSDGVFDSSDESSDEYSSDEDKEIPKLVANGKQEVKANGEKSDPEKSNAAKGSAAGKQKVKIVEPEKDIKSEKDDSDDSDSDDAMSEDDSDEDDLDSSDDEDEEDSDEEEEETPKKQQSGKKRPNESAMKTPGTDKKAKITAQKTDEKKGGVHVATPHPSKQAGKTPGNKSNQKSPASEGSHACKSCNRTFKSETALQSHNQAKHK